MKRLLNACEKLFYKKTCSNLWALLPEAGFVKFANVCFLMQQNLENFDK